MHLTQDHLFQRYCKAVSLKPAAWICCSWTIIIERVDFTSCSFFCRCSRSPMCWSAALFSFTLDPSALRNYTDRHWISSGNTAAPVFTKRLAWSSWRDVLRANRLPCAAVSHLTPRLFFLQVKACFDGCGYWSLLFWIKLQRIRFIYRLTCGHQLLLLKEIVLENWKAVGCGLELYTGFLYRVFFLIVGSYASESSWNLHVREAVLSSYISSISAEEE